MGDEKLSIRDIADTAWWTAAYRALETERRDALFRDPLAKRLAGERGAELLAPTEGDRVGPWPIVVRTLLFDEMIVEEVARGADMVVNLAAGLDARPYRLVLPPTLRWVEVDLPDLITYKEKVLAGEKPACTVTRFPLDLSDETARRALFRDLARSASAPVIVSEGLLVYLSAEDVAGLARDLSEPTNFRRWILDVVSPGLRGLMQRYFGADLGRTGSAFRFAPREGPRFFERHGWRTVEVRSLLKRAARAKRVPFCVRLLAMLPEPTNRQGAWPWAAVCLMEKERV